MALVTQIMAGDEQAIVTYQNNVGNYDTMLVAMSGIYQLKFAKQAPIVDRAVRLMELAKKQINHPMLDLNLAKGYIKQNKHGAAKSIVERVVASHPDNEKAKTLLQSLNKA